MDPGFRFWRHRRLNVKAGVPHKIFGKRIREDTMHTHKHSHKAHRHWPGRTFAACLTVYSLFLPGSPVTSWAQPSAYEPEQIRRLNRETGFSSNWSSTDQFNLEEPIELTVTMKGVDIPETVGPAYLLFSMDVPGALIAEGLLAQDHTFRATLQTAAETRRLKLNHGQFAAGKQAVLRGWPPTPDNAGSSMMLVDEVEFLHNGQKVSLHRPHPRMKKKTANTSKES